MQIPLLPYLCAYFAVVLLALPAHAQIRPPDFSVLDAQLLSMITNRTVSDSDLLQAISRLGRVNEPASVWRGIANDPVYSIQHRRRAVFALLRRHCHACWTCAELERELTPAKWVAESTIEKITHVIGWLPIELRPGETVFKVSVLGGPAFYVRVLGVVEEGVFSAYLRGRSQLLNINPTIVQYAFEDDYDDWFFRPSKRAGPSPGGGKRAESEPGRIPKQKTNE